jgi:endonuclease V-like protein UPF0215 family
MPLHLNKPALRALGIAESFRRSHPRSVLAGAVMRADLRVDGLALAFPTVGGDDATDAVLRLFRRLDRQDINAMILSGVAISWFNIIDIQQIFESLSIPMICLTYEESPGLEGYIHEYFPQPEKKLEIYSRLGNRESVMLKTGHQVFIRTLGLSLDEARILLNKFTLDGRIPEPVRLARMVSRAALRAGIGTISVEL